MLISELLRQTSKLVSLFLPENKCFRGCPPNKPRAPAKSKEMILPTPSSPDSDKEHISIVMKARPKLKYGVKDIPDIDPMALVDKIKKSREVNDIGYGIGAKRFTVTRRGCPMRFLKENEILDLQRVVIHQNLGILKGTRLKKECKELVQLKENLTKFLHLNNIEGTFSIAQAPYDPIIS
jgi:hypothetical protein